MAITKPLLSSKFAKIVSEEFLEPCPMELPWNANAILITVGRVLTNLCSSTMEGNNQGGVMIFGMRVRGWFQFWHIKSIIFTHLFLENRFNSTCLSGILFHAFFKFHISPQKYESLGKNFIRNCNRTDRTDLVLLTRSK